LIPIFKREIPNRSFDAETCLIEAESGAVFDVTGFVAQLPKRDRPPILNFRVSETDEEPSFLYFDDPKAQNKKIIGSFPSTPEDIVSLFHEIGHAVRDAALPLTYFDHARQTDGGQLDVSKAKNDRYDHKIIKSVEERGAWAIGLTALREIGRNVALDAVSPPNMEKYRKQYEYALGTYDHLDPDSIPSLADAEGKVLPAFAPEERRAARKLHDILAEKRKKYLDLFAMNFDPQTGYNYARSPRRLLDALAEHPESLETKEEQKEG